MLSLTNFFKKDKKSKRRRKKRRDFSQVLLIQESVLIWITTLSFLLLAAYSIHLGFQGSLPWLAAMAGCPWAAYGVSQAFYYRKAQAENTDSDSKSGKGIVFAKLEHDLEMQKQGLMKEEEIDIDYGI